jgi:hypothetical protein
MFFYHSYYNYFLNKSSYLDFFRLFTLVVVSLELLFIIISNLGLEVGLVILLSGILLISFLIGLYNFLAIAHFKLSLFNHFLNNTHHTTQGAHHNIQDNIAI